MNAREKFARAAIRQRLKGAPKGKRMEYGRRRSRPAQPGIPEGFISVKDAAILVHRSESGLFRAIAKGDLAGQKIGRFRVIDRIELERYCKTVEERRSRSNTDAWKRRKEGKA